MPATRELAQRIAAGPAVAIQAAKQLVYRSYDTTIEQALEDANRAMAIIRSTEDSKEGPRAFAEKRAPEFKGR